MSDYQRGWNDALDAAVETMCSNDKEILIPLMTPPDHPLFHLFFALKARVLGCKKREDSTIVALVDDL